MRGKPAKQFFQKQKPIVPAKKCWDKNRSKKLRKKVFYIHTNIVTKNGRKKRAKQFLQKSIMGEICWGKNRWKKVRKHVFYIHTNIVTKKWGEKNARKNFSTITPIVRAKNVRKKWS